MRFDFANQKLFSLVKLTCLRPVVGARRMVFLHLLALTCFVNSDAAMADDVASPSGVISLYRSSLESMRELEFEATITEHDKNRTDGNSTRVQKWRFNFDSKLASVVSWPVGADGSVASNARFFEMFASKNAVYTLGGDLKTQVADLMTTVDPVPRTCWIDSIPLDGLAPVIGYLKINGSYRFLPDLLEDAAILNENKKAMTLTADTEEASLRVTFNKEDVLFAESIQLDSKSGKVEFSVIDSTILENRRIPIRFEVRVKRGAHRVSAPAGVKKINGRVVFDPTEANDSRRTIIVPPVDVVYDVTISKSSVRTAIPGGVRLTAKIPDGLSVTSVNSRHLKYEWRKGEVVPLGEDDLR